MVRLADLAEINQQMLMKMVGPTFESRPWVEGPPLPRRRVALITTAGLHRKSDRPFQMGQPDFYRVIPKNVTSNEIMMSHGASSFDRSGYQQDWNVVFPLDRLKELEVEGLIGSVADFHYSFGTPMRLEEHEMVANELTELFEKDQVTAVALFPV